MSLLDALKSIANQSQSLLPSKIISTPAMLTTLSSLFGEKTSSSLDFITLGAVLSSWAYTTFKSLDMDKAIEESLDLIGQLIGSDHISWVSPEDRVTIAHLFADFRPQLSLVIHVLAGTAFNSKCVGWCINETSQLKKTCKRLSNYLNLTPR